MAMMIAKLAAAGGVGVETVRFYQRRGLLPRPARPGGGVRRYDEAAVRRLRFIRHAQAAGFTLAEVGELLALDATENRPRVREIARARVAALDARIDQMTAARDALVRMADDCAGGGAGPCQSSPRSTIAFGLRRGRRADAPSTTPKRDPEEKALDRKRLSTMSLLIS